MAPMTRQWSFRHGLIAGTTAALVLCMQVRLPANPKPADIKPGDAKSIDDKKPIDKKANASDSDREIAQLIEQLGDAEFAVRELAQNRLEKIGVPAYDA